MADNDDAMEDEEDAKSGVPISEHTPESPSETAENMTASEYWKTPSAAASIASEVVSVARNNARGSSNAQSSKSIQEPQEEKLSKSQEEFRKSQEIGLNDKKPSLDELNKDKVPKTTKMYRQCHRRFREIIGKRELRNVELEKHQGDLKKRLNILECSMPAVMVWNMWRMSQGTCVPGLQRIMEKQFEGPASGEVYCPSTPSRHFDCRVREVEAERKQAQKRMQDAKALCAEKEAALEDRNKRLEEAKQLQQEIKLRIEQLTAEVQKLRETAAKTEDDGQCETGECGIIECKKKWLEKVPSCASIKSNDIECLEKLQQLAENEVYMKRKIAELESREEAYMRTLQQADELWCKVDADAASTVSALQEQLHMKTTANQQMADRICQLEDVIEQLRKRLATCRGELEKYMSISKIEALIGKDDDFADVLEKGILVEVPVKDKEVGRVEDLADVDDVGVLVKDDVVEKDILAVVELVDIDLEAKPDIVDVDIEMKPEMVDVAMRVVRADLIDVDDAQMAIHPDDFAYEDERLRQAQDYLARIGSLSELDKYGDDYTCASDFICNDVVLSETGLTEEEMIALNENRVTPQELLEKYGWKFDLAELMAQATVEDVEIGETPVTVPPVEKEQEIEVQHKEVEEPSAKVGVTIEETMVIEETRIEETQAVEDIDSAEEYESLEDTDAIEEITDVEEAIQTPRPVEDLEAIEKYESVEDIEYTERIELVEDITPAEDISLVEDIRPTEEIKPIPTEEIEPRPIAEIAPAEEVKPTPTEEIEPRPVEEIRPTEEVKPIPTEEIEPRPIAEITPVEKVEPISIEDTTTVEEIRPVEDVRPFESATPLEPTIVEKEKPFVDERTDVPPSDVPEEKIDKDNVLVPRQEMLLWQDDVDAIRTTIAKCPDCVDVKKEADQLATMMSAYTGTDVKEIVAKPRPREEAVVKIHEEKLHEREIEVQTKPKVAEVEVTAVAEVEEKEVIVKVPEKPEELIELESEYPLEPPTTPSISGVTPQVETIPEVVQKLEESTPVAPEETPKEVVEELEKMPVIPEVDKDKDPIEKIEEEEIMKETEEIVVEELPKEEIEEKEEKKLPEIVEITVKEDEIDIEVEKPEEKEEELVPEEEEEIKEVPVEEIEEIEVPVDVKEEEIYVEILPEERDEELVEEELVKKEIPVWEEPKILTEEEEEEEEELICTCPLIPPPPRKKIEITQTEITRIETVQVITQTVVDVETQTTPRITRQAQPQLVTITKAIDPDSATMEQLLNYRQPLKERIAAMEITGSSHIHKSTSFHASGTEIGDRPPFVQDTDILRSASPGPRGPRFVPPGPVGFVGSPAGPRGPPPAHTAIRSVPPGTQGPVPSHHSLSAVLQTLRAEGARMKSGPERELRSVYYGKMPGELDQGKCNCCQCGKTMSTPLQGPRTQVKQQPTLPIFKVIPTVPAPKKTISLSTDKTMQHQSFCPECKLRKLQEVLRAQDPLKRTTKKPTKDQEVCTCAIQLGKGLPCYQKTKKKSDRSCMVKIPKAKTDRSRIIEDDEQDSVRCACSGLIETKPGVMKKVHCSCGDPD
ncbi:FK506-binding protein 5-like [Bombus impatiens]|uniref:FK506-binding protein 5-like n=1 Tax=Bombus impatiens TaxID=132113 RepID=A0A6P6FFP5_BOMIM|nr:FK506-binding protein 5-like [Bombus impatiens]